VHPAELRQHLANLQSRLATLESSNAQGQYSLGQVQNDVSQIVERREEEKSVLQKPRFIEDIPGPRMPYTYAITIPFAAGDTVALTRGVTIAADGPFVCTSIQAFWRPTDTQAVAPPQNTWNPVSTLPYRIFSAATGPPVGQAEFGFKITTGGSGRFWQSDWLAGPILDRIASGRSWYQGISGWVERANTLHVEARPEFAIPAPSPSETYAGDVWIYFHGYQILIPINLAEQFGWTV
jgi:hypothetical protein